MAKPLNVLIIEGDEADFLVIRHALLQHGLNAACRQVASLTEMAAALKEGGWDTILTDFAVPGLPFHQALVHIRTHYPDLPVILVTGAIGEETAVDLLREGVWDVVRKDHLIRLVPAVERALGERDARIAHSESEASYRGLFDSIADAIYIQDEHGRFLDVNQGAVNMYGYPREFFLGKTPEFLAAPGMNDLEALADRMRGAFAGEEQVFEFWGLRANGEAFPKEVRLAPARYQGRPVVTAVARDISERKHAERQLSQQHTLLRTILESLPLRVFWKDKDLRYLGCNSAFAADAGATGAQEVIGKDDYQLGWSDQAEIYRADDRKVMDSGQAKLAYQEPQTTPDGRLIWLRTSKVPLRDASGQTTGVLGLYEDISAQKAAGEQLRLNQAALESAANTIVITDREGVIEWANPAFTTLTGYSLDETVGHTHGELVRSDRHGQAYYAEMWRAILAGQVWHGEFSNRRKDGSLFDEEVTITPVRGEDGEIRHFVAVKQDVTERKRLRRHEALRLEILEKIAQSAPLREVLEGLALAVEAEAPGTLCSVLLLDEAGRHFVRGAAPSLPDFYNQAVDGLEIGPGVGSCGAAAHHGRRVIVEDIRSHPNWAPFRDLAARAGLAACWSEPICGDQGAVLGTFAMYHAKPGAPQAAEIELIGQSARLARIAIERHRGAQALAREATQRRLLMEQSRDGIAVLDEDGKVHEVNQAFADMLGYGPEELLRLHVWDWDVSFTREQIQEMGRQSGTQGQRLETRHRRKDGTIIDVDVSTNGVTLDGRKRVLCVHRDITERKAAEAALLVKDRAIATSLSGISMSDLEGRLTYVNQTCLRLWGYQDEQEVLGRPVFEFSQDPNQARDIVARLLRDGAFRGEFVGLRKDGTTFEAELAANLITDAAGNPVCLQAAYDDITARKASEATMHRDREQQRTLRELLETVVRGAALEETLERCLRQMLAVSWLSILPKGGIFLTEADGQSLRLVVSQSLSDEVRSFCASLPFGRCHCGQAAATGRMQYARCVDERHEINYPGMTDHGHYSLPLVSHGRILGVLVLYLPVGFAPDPGKELFLATVADILAGFISRKQEEQARQREGELTRSVMDSLTSSIAVLDKDGNILRVNHAWQAFAQANRAAGWVQEGVGHNYLDACAAAAPADRDAQAALEGIRAVAVGGLASYYLEYPCHSPETRRWFAMQVAPLRQAAGGVVVSHTDITRRKEAELALEDHQQHLEKEVETRIAQVRRQARIIDQVHDSVVSTDLDGVVTSWNHGAELLFGVPAAAAIGRHISFAYPPEEHDFLQWQVIQPLKEKGTHDVDVRMWRVDGTPFYAHLSLSMLHDEAGAPLGMVGYALDITERRRMENALREREADLAHAQAITHMGSWRLDIARDELIWSAETYRIFGVPPEAPLSLGLFAAFLHPEDTERVLSAWSAALAGAPYDIEHRIVVGDQVKWVREQAVVQFDAGHLPVTALGSVQDISQIKAAQLATQKALDEAERLARVKSEFLANMSHEIRTPMNAVLGLARIGQRENKGRRSGETCSRILDAGQHLLGVINDVLDFSKIESGKLGIEAHAFQLDATIQAALDMVGERAQAKGLALNVSRAADLPHWVTGDPLRLKQILVNLLSNAVKFTERGEVALRVAREGKETWFRVIDTGIGMNDEQLSRLFRPFEQADGSTTRKFGGTGLGLAISRNLANLMGGEIAVESATGAGSVFTLRLPLAAARAPDAREAPKAAEAGPRLAHVRVLAAEDVETNRLILEDLLVSEGAHVIFAENGQEALERLEEAGVAGIDVVLMDVQMPVMDGHEATRRIRDLAPELPVIGLTAHALAEEREKCLASGMVAHITKPIDAEELVRAVRRHAMPRQAAAPSAAPEGAAAAPHGVAGCGGAVRIDWAALSVRYGVKPAFIDKLVATVRDSQGETPAKLRAAAREKDAEGVAFIAHNLKGLGGNLEIHALHKLAKEAEDAARAGQESAFYLAAELADLLDRVLAELAADRDGRRV